MCWDPSELHLPVSASQLVKSSDGLYQDVLTRWVLGVSHRLVVRLVVGEYAALSGATCGRAYVERHFQSQHQTSEFG